LPASLPRPCRLARGSVLSFFFQDFRENYGLVVFFIFRAEDQALLGALTISNVRRGVAQMASLGYWIGKRFARQGYMTAAVNTAIPFAFDHLRLHRLEAACLPSNVASIRLLERCGFSEEGLARRYLKINGRWEDHLLFALLASDHDDDRD